MALIYKITNNINHKIYIGKTTRTAKIRWQEHLQEAKTNKSLSPLHLAIKEFGINNFTIEIVEDNISEELINEKEKYYIQKYNSCNQDIGYNILPGGDGGRVYSKLTDTDVKEIINILKDENSLLSFTQIGLQYNVVGSTIRSINNGTSWHQLNIDYPIRKYDTTGLTITKNIYKKIILELQDTKILMKDILKKYNLSESQLTAINQGNYCYNGQHNYYKTIYSGPFPIRAVNQAISEEIVIKILKEYLFSEQSLLSITKKYNVKNSTIIYIFQGKRRKELTKDFLLPIQQHKLENQKIFLNKYPIL